MTTSDSVSSTSIAIGYFKAFFYGVFTPLKLRLVSLLPLKLRKNITKKIMSFSDDANKKYIEVISYAYPTSFKELWEVSKEAYSYQIAELYKKSKLHAAAPNGRVYKLETELPSNLLDLGKKNRPLVLNFGSCTSPPFMANLETFKRLVKNFSEEADFAVIYIAEAHPSDGWAIETNIKIANHRGLDERILAAKRLIADEPLKCPIYVDSMTNEVNEAYAALPERLYIIQDKRIVYHGAKGYNLKEVEQWLEKYNAGGKN